MVYRYADAHFREPAVSVYAVAVWDQGGSRFLLLLGGPVLLGFKLMASVLTAWLVMLALDAQRARNEILEDNRSSLAVMIHLLAFWEALDALMVHANWEQLGSDQIG